MRLYHATRNSLRGLADAARKETSVREELILLLAAFPAGLAIAPSPAWLVAMIGAMLLMLAVEFLNTAIEKLADYLAPERHPAIGLVKDYGSAAVFFSIVFTLLVWLAAILVRLELIGN